MVTVRVRLQSIKPGKSSRVSWIYADHAYLRMSESTVIRKTQEMVTLHHQLIARSDAQVKPHTIRRNQRGAVYAAVIVPQMVLLSIRRRSASDR